MAEKKKPIRTCIACRSSDEKMDLLRIVRSPDGTITIDPTGKKAGRGAYVCRSRNCIAASAKKKGFERALRTAVPAELLSELEKAVRENENAES